MTARQARLFHSICHTIFTRLRDCLLIQKSPIYSGSHFPDKCKASLPRKAPQKNSTSFAPNLAMHARPLLALLALLAGPHETISLAQRHSVGRATRHCKASVGPLLTADLLRPWPQGLRRLCEVFVCPCAAAQRREFRLGVRGVAEWFILRRPRAECGLGM